MPDMPDMFEIVVLLGAPGCGKGTQAVALADQLGLPHVASGDLLRAHRAAATPLGQTAQAAMDRGELVPDDLVAAMVLHRLDASDAKRGALLDGFPRTVPQAEALDDYLAARSGRVRAVIELEVQPSVLVERLAGRRTCPGCQSSFHIVFNPPRVAGTCDGCGTALAERPDDCPDVVSNRVRVYACQTAPLIAYYAARGVLRRVDGERPIDLIASDLRCVVLADKRPATSLSTER